jgi:hypothetical protein
MTLPRGRRYAVRGLLIAATVLAVAAIFAVWASRQVLNADNWANTSTAMLENPAIRSEVSSYLVDQLYANVNVGAELSSALPARLQPLAGPAAGGLQSLAVRATDTALGRPRLQEAWRNANRAAARGFINIAEGKPGALTSSGNAVVLDLGALLRAVTARVGLPGTLAARIPPGSAQVTVVSGPNVRRVQNLATTIRVLAVVLPILALAGFATAVGIARDRRRKTLLEVGIGLIVAGVVVLIGRNVAQGYVVNSLTTTDAVRPAAEAAWSIATRMLRDVAQTTIIAGIPLLAAAWLAGPTRAALSLRRAMAPWLRERPAFAYGAAVVLALLIVWWGPIPATRKPLPALLMGVLLLAGVAVLRRQTAEEFPDATVEEAHAAWSARLERMRASLGGRRRRGAAPAAQTNGAGGVDTAGTGAAAAAPAAAAPAGPGAAPPTGAAGGPPAGATAAPGAPAARPGDSAESAYLVVLERLATLHDRGVLTDAEFSEEKTRVLERSHNGA